MDIGGFVPNCCGCCKLKVGILIFAFYYTFYSVVATGQIVVVNYLHRDSDHVLGIAKEEIVIDVTVEVPVATLE